MNNSDIKEIDLKKVRIKDPFWSKHVDLVRNEIIPYQWEAMNDCIPDAEPSHSIDNFAIAAGLKEGKFYGVVFQDTDIAKWLETVGFSLAVYPDEELERTADEVIDIIEKAQCEDGYLDTYFMLERPEKRWKNLCEGHELYTAGHLMEAAVAYYQGTGKRKLLDVVIRLADLICETFGPEENKMHGYPGHPEVEIGLIKLYRVTGNRKYLDMAKYFVDIRGVGENYFLKEIAAPDFEQIFPDFANYDPSYSQSHKPVREQDKAEGHAVRGVYLYSAMADLAREYLDTQLLEACKRIWNNMVNRRMYITGGIGSSGLLERFTTDYDLPNDCNYSESCASIGLAMFGNRMAAITKDASYIDVVERALYNTVLAGLALDGKSFFYVNPLEVWPDNCMPRTSREHVKPVRQKWFGVACCPPNIARTLASMGQYIYGRDEECIYLNLFISNDTVINAGEKEIKISVETKFPYENVCKVSVSNVPEDGIKIAIRKPDYARNYQVAVDGRKAELEVLKGYVYLELKEDSDIQIFFEAPARFVRANPLVRADSGKIALMRGPLVYCLEEIDNGANLSALYVDAKTDIREEKSELFGGSILLHFRGKRIVDTEWKENELYAEHPIQWEETELTAVPYAYWNNRGMGEMSVWIKEINS
ncbi:MAG: glycoside hydrolase family 127 protein [Lachnospiraceae bacterium]